MYIPFLGIRIGGGKEGLEAGEKAPRAGVYTCWNHSSATDGPVRIKIDKAGKKLPKCPICKGDANWIKGK